LLLFSSSVTFFTFAYSSCFAWIIERFLHLRSIVNNKLLVFAQPIEGGDNVGEIHTLGNDLIRSLPYGFQIRELIDVNGDCAFCFHHKLFLCTRHETSLSDGWWDAFAMQPTKTIHGFRSHRHASHGLKDGQRRNHFTLVTE